MRPPVHQRPAGHSEGQGAVAVLMFRLIFLLIPLAFAIAVMIPFERQRFSQAHSPKDATPRPVPQKRADRVGRGTA